MAVSAFPPTADTLDTLSEDAHERILIVQEKAGLFGMSNRLVNLTGTPFHAEFYLMECGMGRAVIPAHVDSACQRAREPKAAYRW